MTVVPHMQSCTDRVALTFIEKQLLLPMQAKVFLNYNNKTCQKVLL